MGRNIIDSDGRECSVVDWIHLAQDRVQRWGFVTTVMNFSFPYRSENFLVVSRKTKM
jgi:hypothetical protein